MIHLIMKNLCGFIKNKVVFVLFSMALVISLLVVLFIYSIFASINSQGMRFQTNYQVATIDFMEPAQKEMVSASMEELNRQRDDMAQVFFIFQDGENMITASFTGSPYNYGGRYFSKKDLETGTALAILAASLYDEYHESGKITINNQIYDILAFSDRPFSEVPLKALPPETEIGAVQILFKNMLSQSMIKTLDKQIKSVFPNAYVALPSEPDLQSVSTNLYRSYVSLLIIILALINLSFLYRYILKKREKSYGVYRICGCSRLKGILLYYAEILILTTGIYILTCLLYHFSIQRFASLINNALTYSLFPIDYIILYWLYVLFVSLIFIPVIVLYNFKKPVDLIK